MFRFFRDHYRTHTRGVVVSAIGTGIAAVAEGLMLVALVAMATRAAEGKGGVSFDTFGVGNGLTTLELVLITGFLLVFSSALRVFSLWSRARTVASWEKIQRVRAIRLITEADYEHTAQLSPAELQGVVGLVSVASSGLMIIAKVINAAISFGVLVAMGFIAAPLTALGMAVVGGLLVVMQRPLGKLSRDGGRKLTALMIESGRLIDASAREGREVRIFGAQRSVQARFRVLADEYAVAQRRLTVMGGLAPQIYQTLGMLFVIAALGIALSVSSLDVAVLGAVALLFIRSLGYGQQLSGAQQEYHQMVPSVERLDDELDGLSRSIPTFGDEHTGRIREVQINEVGYRYPGQPDDDVALEDVKLLFETPGVIGLAGKSGSGKSTLAQLLLRLRHSTFGSILVNGHPIDSYSAESWTKQVALVPQYPQLIRGSLRENLTFFRDGISDDQLRRVAEAVGLDDFFMSLPNGYETELGESGRDLSGGQLQRLGIARALVGNPSLLVLDEPTSALDAETEQWVQRAIRTASEQALVVIISHRSSTLELCDRVVRLKGGRVVDDGMVATVTATFGPDAQAAS